MVVFTGTRVGYCEIPGVVICDIRPVVLHYGIIPIDVVDCVTQTRRFATLLNGTFLIFYSYI